jgi:hypothetical protein
MFSFRDRKKTSPERRPAATARASRSKKTFSAATIAAYQRTKKQLAAQKLRVVRDWGWSLATLGVLLIRLGTATRSCSGVVSSHPLLVAIGTLAVLPGLYLVYKSYF